MGGPIWWVIEVPLVELQGGIQQVEFPGGIPLLFHMEFKFMLKKLDVQHNSIDFSQQYQHFSTKNKISTKIKFKTM